MWVVKLGGSLNFTSNLKQWLKNLCEYGKGKVVIVPGGGRFADQVREHQRYWAFDDAVAHRMAILAMHQTGLLFSGIEPSFKLGRTGEIKRILSRRKTAVWLPDVKELNRDGVPANWAVTSDSLAAWLAEKLSAERLVLVKSKLPLSLNPSALRASRIVDEAFFDWLPNIPFVCYHHAQLANFTNELRANLTSCAL